MRIVLWNIKGEWRYLNKCQQIVYLGYLKSDWEWFQKIYLRDKKEEDKWIRQYKTQNSKYPNSWNILSI
jgi:hypothetical protein